MILGEDMIQADGNLDRDKLGKRVFKDEAARRQLDEIMHPAGEVKIPIPG